MLKWMLLPVVAIGSLMSAPTSAQKQVTRVYQGFITHTCSANAAEFYQVGDPVKIAYTLDLTAQDSRPQSDTAAYEGLKKISVWLPRARQHFTMGPGSVQLSNSDHDSVVFFGYGQQKGTLLNGQPQMLVELVFLAYPESDGTPASMISDDSMPTHHLLGDDDYVSLYDQQGNETCVFFVADPDKQHVSASDIE